MPLSPAPTALRRQFETCDSGAAAMVLSDADIVSFGEEDSRRTHVRSRAAGSSSRARPVAQGHPYPVRQARRKTKGSWRLTGAQRSNLIAASRHAAPIGLPLNRFVTINWEAAGVADGVSATGRFLKHAQDWLRRHRHRLAYIWVQERGRRIGQHVHILLHVPPTCARRFGQLQRRWLRASGATLKKGIVKTRPVGRDYAAALRPGNGSYLRDLGRVLRYVMKQSSMRAGTRTHHWDTSGSFVLGKRCSTSENIGSAARTRFGSVDELTLSLLISIEKIAC
jgi:hypothetical protein